jgi:hypothetical protein
MYTNSNDKIEDLNQKPVFAREATTIKNKFFGPQRGMNLREYAFMNFSQALLQYITHMTPEDIIDYSHKLTNLYIQKLETFYAENSEAAFAELDTHSERIS